MAWSDPAGHVFAVGEFLQSSILNTYLKDNLLDIDRRTTPQHDAVTATETTTATAYGDLTSGSPGPAVSVNIGSSGLALVCLYCRLANSTAATETFMGYAVSVGTTVAASDDRAISNEDSVANIDDRKGAVFVHSGLTPGANTFTSQYKVSAGTGTFSGRRLTVIPLGS